MRYKPEHRPFCNDTPPHTSARQLIARVFIGVLVFGLAACSTPPQWRHIKSTPAETAADARDCKYKAGQAYDQTYGGYHTLSGGYGEAEGHSSGGIALVQRQKAHKRIQALVHRCMKGKGYVRK
jgi:hypothetical protein